MKLILEVRDKKWNEIKDSVFKLRKEIKDSSLVSQFT